MAPYGTYGGPSYSGRNRPPASGGPSGVSRSYASQHKEHEPLFNTYEHLSGLPQPEKALTMLRTIASAVKPLMRKRGWLVKILAEFFPAEQNLLGLNINRGYKICVRLRYHNHPELFLPTEQVVDTLMHELAHIVWGEHDGKFHALWEELRDEREVLVRRGFSGEGFLGEGRALGGLGRGVGREELRRLARRSAEERKARGSVMGDAGGRKLGGKRLVGDGRDAREVIAGQALLRNTIDRGCGSGRQDAGEISEESSKGAFKTKGEEEEANERAIAQAVYELMEQEEEAKLKGTFKGEPKEGGLAWSEEVGLYDPKGGKDGASIGGQPSEEEQLRWALEESRRSNASATDDPSSHPPESFKTPPVPTAPNPPAPANLAPKRKHAPSTPSPRPSPSTATTQQPQLHPKPPQTTIDLSSSPSPQPTGAALHDPDLWTCEICTCINPTTYLSCEACGIERPASSFFPPSNPNTKPKPTKSEGSSLRNLQPSRSNRTAEILQRAQEKERREREEKKGLGWKCGCGAFMEHRWWTCSACGGMKGSS